MSVKATIIGGLLLASLSFGAGYWLTPTKVVEKKVEVRDVKQRIHSVTRVVKRPDGTIEKVVTRDAATDSKDTATTDKTTTRSSDRAWLLVGNIPLTPTGPDPLAANLGLYHRLFGGLYVGVGASRDSIGVGLAVNF